MLGRIAGIAVILWLFRLDVFWGILGRNVARQVVVDYLCQVLGIERRRPIETTRIVLLEPLPWRPRKSS
jgi:hypothetical protein